VESVKRESSWASFFSNFPVKSYESRKREQKA
jgi:hypothetical protein